MTGPLDGPEGMPRPDNPDVWKLIEIVLQLDGATKEGGEAFEKLIAEAVDPASLTYLAMQRAIRVVGAETRADVQANLADVVRLASVYHEAFLLGFRYYERYGPEAK